MIKALELDANWHFVKITLTLQLSGMLKVIEMTGLFLESRALGLIEEGSKCHSQKACQHARSLSADDCRF